MGIVRRLLIGILALAFVAAAGNLAYLTLTEEDHAGASLPEATVPTPLAPPANATPAAIAGPTGSKDLLTTAAPVDMAADTSVDTSAVPQGETTAAPLAFLFERFAPTSDTGDATEPQGGLPQARIDAVTQTWRAWMTEQSLSTGAMALALPDGRVIGAEAGRPSGEPAPVASLSKAITGLCLDGLLAERGLSWDTALGDIAEEMSVAGVTPRPWNAHITLAGLATHTSGLQPDLTQGALAGRTHGALGLHRRIASEALAEGAIGGQPGNFFYSNTNYAVLGVVIEALSGQSYAQTCMERVMAPAGVEGAVIEGRMGSMSAHAGWEVSAEDYARLARHWFAAGQPHVDRPDLGPNSGSYAMGYEIADRGSAAIVSHHGVLCIDQFARSEHGASFVALGTGVAFAANWNGCLDPAQYDALIERITAHLR